MDPSSFREWPFGRVWCLAPDRAGADIGFRRPGLADRALQVFVDPVGVGVGVAIRLFAALPNVADPVTFAKGNEVRLELILSPGMGRVS